MNKNGEKEGKCSKGQKKFNKSTKVNKPKGGDNRVPADEKCGEADDISNKFPNFSLLNEEERLVFYQALTAARKNVEKRGVLTRERFGTVHDEYLKHFDHEDKKEEGGPDEVSVPVASNITVPEGSVGPSCGWSAEGFHGLEPSEETKSQSPTLLLEGSSEAPLEGADLVTIESGLLDRRVSDQCESVIRQDTDKVMGMYLNKKKRNEAKFEEFRPGGKEPDQCGERKAPKPPKKDTAEREKKKKQKKKKESTLAYQVSETPAKTSGTPRFDALSAEERDLFFNILQEARNSIVGKNPERKGEILPLHAIVKRYTGDRPATSVYTTRVQESPRRCQGKKNLKVKVTLTSGDNERLKKTKSEDLSDTEKRDKRHTPSERPYSEDVDIDHICENEADTEDLVEKDERNKPKGKPSNQSVSGKLQRSSLTIDIKSSPGLKNVRSVGEKMPSTEAKPSEAIKNGDGNVKKAAKNQSYYTEVLKSPNEPQRNTCPRGRKTHASKLSKLQTGSTPSEHELIKQKKKPQEEMEEEMLQEPLYEGSLEERPNLEELVEECMEQEEDEDENEEEEGEEEEEECGSLSMARPECQVGSCGTCVIERGEKMREGSYTGTCTIQVSSVVVQDSQEVTEEVQKKEEEEPEAKAQGSCFPGDQWGASSKDKHSLMTAKSLCLGGNGEGRGGECSSGKFEGAAKEEEKEERAEGRPSKDEEEEMKEFSGMPASAKVMIVDDNVIEKIRKLIYYLEAKAGKDDRLEKEYMKLLVDYVDYLSKVLEALVHKKGRRSQVQSAYPAEVSLKFEEGSEGEKGKEEKSKIMPRSVSAQEFGTEGILGSRKKASEENFKVKNEQEGVSMSLSLSDSDGSLRSMQEATYMPPASSSKKVVATKIRLLQDLLKKRAEIVEGSTDDLKIIHHPQEEYVPEERPPTVKLITEEDEEHANKGHGIKVIKFLMKCFTCGKKKQEEDGIFDNLKGEAVRVDVCDMQSKDPANATLNQSTMEVLKAAGRKRIIEKYYGKN